MEEPRHRMRPSKRAQIVRPPNVPKRAEPKPWHAYLTIDVLSAAACRTIFHPFLAWILVLSLRAVTVPFEDLSMRIAIAYAGSLTGIWVLCALNHRFAYGRPREVDYDEEVVLITGGASGLGRLIADFFAMRGAAVAVLDVKKAESDGMMGIRYYQCDVGSREEVGQAVKSIRKDLGTPTILINNAGVMCPKPVLELSADEVEQTMKVNLLSHWYTVQTCLPDMLKEKRGTIVTVASVLGYIGALNLSAYTASKAGLLAFHRSLQAELAASPDPAATEIKTVLVAPGQLDTQMFQGMKTPSHFLAPVVAPVELAKAIVDQIDSGWSGEVCLPLYSNMLPLFAGLPAGLQKLLRTLSGMDDAMLDFTESKRRD